MERTFVLDTRNRPRLLIAMMQALAGVGSRISFEGVLSHTELAGMKDVVKDETAVLKRATLQPRLDFVILPLTQESVPAIIRAVVSKIAFGNKGILHVQIEKNGKVAFAAYDNFHHECVVAHSAIPSTLLDELTTSRVLRSYKQMIRSEN